nr:immunoglobulin heavy chain junction region [Macaca mulatta]MPN70010.1 immunoglobulin heavy chain junction region [Macaca mulatta]MPN70618.1 immunoglobulin heavy chain junction region [Macaca mulatta]MPN72039.1 immunoglobulin heavy chain junction region [Macaca mulatta]MPN72236.1 immunoglobulin heavy chain junction region [Macaca mulatta]
CARTYEMYSGSSTFGSW